MYDHVVFRNGDIEDELATLNCEKRLLDAPPGSTFWLETSELDLNILDEATPETAASAAEETSSTLQSGEQNDLIYLSASLKNSGPKAAWSNRWDVIYSYRLRNRSMRCYMQPSTLIDPLGSNVQRHPPCVPVTVSVFSTFL